MTTRFNLTGPAAWCLLALAGSVGAIQAAPPDTARRFTVDRYLELQTAGDPQVSPDGSQVVYTRTMIDKMADKPQAAVWLVSADGQHHRFLAKGSGGVWAPGGSRIAYLGEGQNGIPQIFVQELNSPGSATQITWGAEAPANLHWSPDGRSIGFSMVVPSPEKWAIDLPAAPEGAKWASTPRYTERLHYRRDHVGLTERGFRHLFLVAADGGAPRQITHGDWSISESVYEYMDSADWAFTPDGRSAIVEGFNEGDGDRNDQDCYLYLVDLDTGAARRLTTTAGSWRRPAVSPDGKTIAFVGFPKNDDGYRVANLYTMSADGSNISLRSAAFDREPEALVWAPDNSAVYFTAEDHGSVHVYSWATRGGVRQLTTGPEVVKTLAVGRGALVTVRSGPKSPGDIELFDPRKPTTARRLTHLNDELLRGMDLAQVDEISFDSSGGARIQGWVVKPPGFDPTRHYPLLLEIHGGPYAMYNVAFNPSFENFAANGYMVLFLNPRGSTGYGNDFNKAIARHYPGVDYDDLMAGVDTVTKQGSVDESHMYVAGCSGGGVLSSWVIGHTDRFAAAAVRCPVTDWISMIGETDIPFFTQRFFRKPYWEDPSDWLAQSSLMHVGNVKTPTLLMTGELDRRTPIAQTEEYYAALKLRGVPSALLRFDGEYHGTAQTKPSNWMRTQLYMMSWFQRYGANPSDSPPR
jgi:dipeptidyl aminopeptidase/acylaminoacyl peptidase